MNEEMLRAFVNQELLVEFFGFFADDFDEIVDSKTGKTVKVESGKSSVGSFRTMVKPGSDVEVTYDKIRKGGESGIIVRSVPKDASTKDLTISVGGKKVEIVPGKFIVPHVSKKSSSDGGMSTGLKFILGLLGIGGAAYGGYKGYKKIKGGPTGIIKNRIPPGSNVTLQGLKPETIMLYDKLSDYLASKGIEGPWVTSAVRSTPRQASVMAQNWKSNGGSNGGREYLRGLYNKAGIKKKAYHFDRFDAVLKAHEGNIRGPIPQAKVKQILQDMVDDGVFPSSHKAGRALDIRSWGKYGEGARDALENVIGKRRGRYHDVPGVGQVRWIIEKKPFHYHVKVKG